VKISIVVFWIVTYGLVGGYQCYGGTYATIFKAEYGHIALLMEAVSSSETSNNVYWTAWHNIPYLLP
jgi:hypothetical protein